MHGRILAELSVFILSIKVHKTDDIFKVIGLKVKLQSQAATAIEM